MKKILFCNLVLIFLLFISPAAFAAESDLNWLTAPEGTTITNFSPEESGDGFYNVGVEVGERIYTATSPEGAGSFYRGYVDYNGNWAIPPIYNYGSSFSNELARVKETIEEKRNGLVYIRTVDRIIDRFGHPITAFDQLQQQGYLFDKPQDGYVVLCCPNSSTHIPSYGLANADGKIVLPTIYSNVNLPKDGLCLVQTEKGSYGYFDTQGNAIILPQYNDAKDFSEKLAAVQKDNQWGFIDQSGTIQIPLIYDDVQPFSETYAAVKKNNRWGFIDSSGKLIIPCLYDAVTPFSEGVASVCIKDQWGCINTKGKEILPCIYQAVEPCSENRIAVKQHDRYGYFDKSGKKIIDFLYGGALAFHEGFAVVSSGDFSNCKWDSYWQIGAGLTRTYNNNTFGLIDLWGNKILSEDYICISNVQNGSAICQRASDKKVGIFYVNKNKPTNTKKQSQSTKTVTVTLPNFNVTINGQTLNNTYRKYPFIMYKGITYFPMTYSDSRLLGVRTNWSGQKGLEINNGTKTSFEYKQELVAKKNKKQQTACIANRAITVNGKKINNMQETYPFLVFRDITYIPLTWRFIVGEFNWLYQFDSANGLKIENKTAL